MAAIANLPDKPRINIRQKGAGGEREIAKALNSIIQKCLREAGFDPAQIAAAATSVQRNQNQSAVGGNDLSHTMGMSLEVKRQETLSINTWWRQCVAAAKPNCELPVLVYRQNNRSWRVVTTGFLHLPGLDPNSYSSFTSRVEIDWDTFQLWFEHWVNRKLSLGELPNGMDI